MAQDTPQVINAAPTTSPHVILIVIGALAVMAMTYMGTMAYCLITGIKPEGDMVRSFEAAGIYVLGALSGLLANTRTQQVPDNTQITPVKVVNTSADPAKTRAIKDK